MDYRVVVERRARRDVEEIFAFLARDAPHVARHWYEELRARLARLSHMPKRCALARESELAALGVRQLLFGRFRILFTVNELRRSVHVHHVRHGARGELELRD